VSPLVIDVSVAAKWCLGETRESLVPEALDLLDQYINNQIEFVIPDFFWAELGNVLWKAVRVGRCSRIAAEIGLFEMKQRRLPTVPSETLAESALDIAINFNRSVYDSLYVALAVRSGSQVITADERLANALAAHLPVKWLGALSK
jgi:predicted nucleic acid-binding protein